MLAILATPEWNALFDSTTKDIVKDGSSQPDLNSHLFSSLSQCMRGNNIKLMQSKKHLNQDGIGFYQALRNVHKTQLSGYELRKRHGAFGISKITPSESIDDFAARLLTEKRALEEESLFTKTISQEELKEIFIYGLPPDFTDVKRKIRNLNNEWSPMDINELIPVTKNYLQETLLFRSDNKLYAEQRKKHNKAKDTSDKPDK